MQLFKQKFNDSGIDGKVPQAPQELGEKEQKLSFLEKMKGVWADAKEYLPDLPQPKMPELAQKASEKSWNFLKNIDWKGNVYSAGAGMAIRIGAKVFCETASFGAKTGVAALAGGAVGGVRDWWKQRKDRNDKANKLVEDIIENVILNEYRDARTEERNVRNFPPFFVEIADKKKRGEKLSISDFKKYLKAESNSGIHLHLVDAEAEKLRKTILGKIEDLKINKKQVGLAILKGAAAGAIGSMAIGELIHLWDATGLSFPDASEFLTWVKKGFPSGATQEIVAQMKTEAIFVDVAATPYGELIKEKLYSFHSDKIQSLTEAARNLVHDYLLNESKGGSTLALSNLSIPQMVYAEDYLRRSMEKLGYQAGTKVEDISGKLIAEAVESARNLSKNQIENLSTMLETPGHQLSTSAKMFMKSKDYSQMAINAVRHIGGKLGKEVAGALINETVDALTPNK